MKRIKQTPHYAELPMLITPASITPPAIESRTTFSKKIKHIQEEPEKTVFRKLIECYKYFDDPLHEIVLKSKKKRKGTKVIRISAQYTDIPRCSCCNEKKESTAEDSVQKQYMYNSPEPPTSVCRRFGDRLEKITKFKLSENYRDQYPLSAISLRWYIPGQFSLVDIYCLMASYGSIVKAKLLSPNSAVVMFSNLADACRVVDTWMIGPPTACVFARWVHRSMDCRKFYSNGVRLITRNNEMANATQ